LRAKEIISQREKFLELLDFWCAEVQGNEFEYGYKNEAEPELLALEELTRPYRTVHFKMLYRGTGGISRQKASVIRRYKKQMTFDMTESVLSSWTTNPDVARDFAEKFKGTVLSYPTSTFDVFLSFSDVWHSMNQREQKDYGSIRIGASEAEVLVRHPPQLTVTYWNVGY
jgi:hypothetical protein